MFYFQSLLWKFGLEALLQVTHYPLPALAGSAANGFWQIVSFKETNNLTSAIQGSDHVGAFLLSRPSVSRFRASLAYLLNGQELPAPHGAPLRLRIPRQLGYKSIKYLSRIPLTDSLKHVGDGRGSSEPAADYSWFAGI
jgi:DMSO/TMAO reductase YedYZ molybdopterin-dependent catalytic subunit